MPPRHPLFVASCLAVALVTSAAAARAETPRQRVFLDVPVFEWGWLFGHGHEPYPDEKIDETALLLGIGAHWEYAVCPYVALGAGIDVQVDLGGASPVLVLPQLAARFLLPLAEGRIELYLLARGGVAVLHLAEDGYTYDGVGGTIYGALGLDVWVTPEVSIGFHGGYRLTSTEGDRGAKLAIPVSAEGALTVGYRF